VIIVKQGVPTGVISRGTLLRWLGNWGAIARDQQPGPARSNLGQLCRHIQATASAIIHEAERLKNDAPADADDPIPRAVNAATRLQEQAQALIALSQIQYRFEPRIRETPAAADPLPLTSAASVGPFGITAQDSALLTCAQVC
jgi:uncharacterized damage-inducible protein DinB